MKKKFYGAVLAGIVILGSLTGCGSNASVQINDAAVNGSATGAKNTVESSTAESSTETTGGELKVVKFGSPNSGGKLLFELLEVAYEDGSLEEELNAVGYTGEYKIVDAAGPGINEAFAVGEVDIAVYGDFPATTAKSNGIETTVIGVSNSDQAQSIFVREGSGIETVADLEGKRVAVGIGTNYQYYWENLVEGEGLDISKIEVVNSFDYGTLLSTGEVDAVVSGVVASVYYEANGLGHILVDSSEHSDWTTEFLVVANTEFINANPDVGVAVNKALIRAKEAVDKDATVLAQASSNNNISVELIQKGHELVGISGYDPDTFVTVTPGKLQRVIDLMYADGLIINKIEAKDWIDTKYYEQAKSELQQ